MKRLFGFILLLTYFISFLSLAGCGETAVKEAPKQEAVPEITYEDYGGAEFVILQHQEKENPFGYKQDSLLADQALTRLSTIGERHNCSFTIETLAYGDSFSSQLIANLAVMDNFCDIIFSHNCSKLRLVGNAGGLVAMDEVSDIIDYKNHDKWGDVEALEAMMCKGVLYGVAPSLWLNYTPIPFYTLVYNNSLIKTFGVPNPHELYENKQWTRDSLVELIKTCTDLNGTTPIYGMAATLMHLTRQAILSNGCKMLNIAEDGTVSNGWDTEEAVEALTWLQKTVNENIECFFNKTQDYQNDSWNMKIPFMNNEATFVLTRPEFIFDEIAYKVEDFGLMPWPAGPNVEYGVWPGYYENIPPAARKFHL
jgi:ABC-type glycerol-3-phosphate transport system substrate-binding protein